jgi:hypothetical protein
MASNDTFYLEVWNETNRRARIAKKHGDLEWNRIWQRVIKEYSQKENNNERY